MKSSISQEEIQTFSGFNKASLGKGRYRWGLLSQQDEKRVFTFRDNEPCYGGLRKYVEDSGEEATQPENKPSDLLHVFPKGEPLAACFPFNNFNGKNGIPAIFQYMWSDESPWRAGFESADSLLFTKVGDAFSGVICLSTDGEPTTLINLAKITRAMCAGRIEKFDRLKEFGCTDFEALCGTVIDYGSRIGTPMPYDYEFSNRVNLKAFREGEIANWAEGSLRERKDYSRKHMSENFRHGKTINFCAELSKALKGGQQGVLEDLRPEIYVKALKTVVASYA